MRLTKKDLIKELTDKLEMKESLSRKVIELLLKTIQDAIIRGEEVNLTGIGSLKIKNIAAREGKCAGREYKSPASKSIKIKASETIRKLLNK